ncbi:hypothetical protein [Secundilactobacillus paracollinoides]|uniref:hypothetical protein n=1 Tax=Secundilactobacillus paracollinoides TaxID=240427 RepID=UPI001CDA67DD|nr:hypothetical protein [Secundilactobacillus paracollinoides]
MIGFGTWQSADGDEAYHAVLDALKAGYRHIDTPQRMVTKTVLARPLKILALTVTNSS